MKDFSCLSKSRNSPILLVKEALLISDSLKWLRKFQKTFAGKLTRFFISLQRKVFKAGEISAGFRKKYCKILSKTFISILLKLKLDKRKT